MVEQDPRAGEQAVTLAVVHGDCRDRTPWRSRTANVDGTVSSRSAASRAPCRTSPTTTPDRSGSGCFSSRRPSGSPRASSTRPTRSCSPSTRPGRAQRHERDRPQVVDLVGLRQLQRRDQRRQVGEIARNQLDERHLVDDLGRLRVALALDHPVHVVAPIMQELGEMTTVLTSDPSDERSRQRTASLRTKDHGVSGPRTGRATAFRAEVLGQAVSDSRRINAAGPLDRPATGRPTAREGDPMRRHRPRGRDRLGETGRAPSARRHERDRGSTAGSRYRAERLRQRGGRLRKN